ncbi:6-bladed beta-propeller [Parabacteroides sp. OttesenSCG-928-G07]|nr:6-bladed beta-propeller [Parabacteroides sp. OttesenSCG-928-G21]MDL2277556.1 6-bladed beta-propeller [Parabacteroides sp. OttesenSCG-928-G07]
MKTSALAVSIMASLILYGCSSSQPTQGDVIQIDVTKNYPEKEIKLTDIADVSYVRFDAEQDEYLFQGYPVSITANNIVILDSRIGDFYFFTKEGKPKSTFNRRGNGPEEYVNTRNAVYDEENDELFVCENNIIKVYSSAGAYKRTLSLPKKAWIQEIIIYDNNSLIIYDVSVRNDHAVKKLNEITGEQETKENAPPENEDKYLSSIIRVSKTDGSLIEYIDVPENYDIELTVPFQRAEFSGVNFGPSNRMLKHKDGLVLCNQETGVVFLYDNNQSLNPVLEQKPLIETMNPIIYINNFIETRNYQFIEVITLKVDDSIRFPSTHLMRDKQDGSLYRQKTVLDEFKGKEIFISPTRITSTRNAQIGLIQFTLDELKEAYDSNKLSGELKDLVADMDEEENDIYVLLDFK